MDRLPFYVTPEEFENLQDVQESNILKSDDLLLWTSYNLDFKNRWLRKKLWFISASLITLFLIGIGLSVNPKDFTYLNEIAWIYIVCLSIGWSSSYVSYAIDDYFEYIVSSKGIVVKQSFSEPKWVSTFVKWIGVVGSVISFTFFMIIGPSALVGVGGFLLLSFVLLNKKPPRVDRKLVLKNQILGGLYNKNRNVVCIFSSIDSCFPSMQIKDGVYRAHVKSALYLFPNKEVGLSNIVSFIQNELGISIKETDDIDEIFEMEKRPEEYQSFSGQMENFSLDELKLKKNLK